MEKTKITKTQKYIDKACRKFIEEYPEIQNEDNLTKGALEMYKATYINRKNYNFLTFIFEILISFLLLIANISININKDTTLLNNAVRLALFVFFIQQINKLIYSVKQKTNNIIQALTLNQIKNYINREKKLAANFKKENMRYFTFGKFHISWEKNSKN